MKKRKLFKNTGEVNTEFSLQITPMASVFVVTLVFLLKNMTMGVSSLTPTQDLSLPELHETEQLYEGLRVEVSKDSIAVDGQVVMSLNNFNFDVAELDTQGGFSRLSESIRSRAGISYEDTESSRSPAQENGDSVRLSRKRVLVMADVNTPYSTLKRIFTSTANEGYELLKLVVINENN